MLHVITVDRLEQNHSGYEEMCLINPFLHPVDKSIKEVSDIMKLFLILFDSQTIKDKFQRYCVECVK